VNIFVYLSQRAAFAAFKIKGEDIRPPYCLSWTYIQPFSL
jgi:hypothetical protein